MAMTDLSCGMKCLKYLLFVVNFIVWICGIVVMAVGIYSRVKSGDWSDLVNDASVADAANLLIASGAIVMVIGFVGCCGAVKQNRPFLIIYIILLLLIFILEIAGGIYAYTKKDDMLDALKKGLEKTSGSSYIDDTPANKGYIDGVDWFQQNVKCCGVDNPASWLASDYYKAKAQLPKSCCLKESDGCGKVANSTVAVQLLISTGKIYGDGCVKAGEQFLKDHMIEIGGVGVGVAFVQIIGIIFAILLVRSINENKM